MPQFTYAIENITNKFDAFVTYTNLQSCFPPKKNANNEKRVEKAIDSKEKKINGVIDAENNLANQKEQKDNAKLENLSIQDQVNFSTLSIQIYQHETVKQEMNANTKDYNYYKPNIGIRLLDSLKSGWYVLLDVIVFLVQIWWLLSLADFFFTKSTKKEMN